jgi:hypothetical protein
MSSRRAIRGAALVVAGYVLATIIARALGYQVGGDTPVRCRQGHVFTSIWVPGVSLKAVRLGWQRLQWCPVGGHWSLVTPQRAADLSVEDLLSAAAHHDLRLP